MQDHKALEALIDRMIEPRNFSRENKLDLKIALLSYVLDQLKHERKVKDELVSFENYTQCEVFADTNRLVVTAPAKFDLQGSGTTPIQLQSLLLLFLLTHHGEQYRVLDIIQHFIDKIRGQLKYLDFKKTKTGATRCFTNTRFAAKTLRDYGLLKYTQREAFKTWELSLTGLLVAAAIYDNRRSYPDPWCVPLHRNINNADLAGEIYEASVSIQSYEVFVKRLASLCEPDAKVFKTFQPALEKAYALLKDYWVMMHDAEMTKKKRQQASLECVRKLEKEGIDDDFYLEFSRCVQINKLMDEIPLSE